MNIHKVSMKIVANSWKQPEKHKVICLKKQESGQFWNFN